MTQEFKAYLVMRPEMDTIELFVRTGDGVIRNMVEEQLTRGLRATPMLEGENARAFVQAVMDAGWKAGLKPAGYEEANRELAATKYHLEDMRKIALSEPAEHTMAVGDMHIGGYPR